MGPLLPCPGKESTDYGDGSPALMVNNNNDGNSNNDNNNNNHKRSRMKDVRHDNDDITAQSLCVPDVVFVAELVLKGE